MTVQEFFNYVHDHPQLALYFYLGVPVFALIISWISEPQGYQEPWKYLYSVLIYAACIPGIFAVTLNIYFFFWERRSLMDSEILVQWMPVLSMIATLIIIRRYVSFDAIPGFDKLSGLMTMIAVLLTMMWILDRTHIYAFTYMPIWMVLVIVVGGILLIRWSLRGMMRA